MSDTRIAPILASCAVLLSACGEAGDVTLPVVSLQRQSLAFSVTAPDDPTPAPQTFAGTFNVDAVYLGALTEGTAVERVSYSLAGKIATISVYPKSPAALGPGIHQSRVTVFGQVCADARCSQLASGPAQSIDVTYSIPQVIRQISPYVAQEQTAGSAIIRGAGFQRFTVTSVLFGNLPASSFSVTGDTQIQATYPPLAAGRYPVQLQVDGASLPVKSDAELVVVGWPAFVTASLPYPTVNTTVSKVLYDAERNAVLAVTTQGGGELLRFQHAGDSWGTAETLPINTLHDIALSADGRSLLAITDGSVVPIDANTLAPGSAWDAPVSSGTTLTSIAVDNDGNAIVTTTAANATTSPLYLFNPRTGAFDTPISLANAAAAASGDGTLTVIVQQDATGATTPSLYDFTTARGSLATTGLSGNRNAIAPALDRYATRLALNGAAVYSGSYAQLGTLPDTTLAVAFSPDGARSYAYDSGAAAVLVYDSASSPGSTSVLNLIDTLTDITGDPGSTPQIAVSAVGDAVFLAGLDTISVIPVAH